MQRKQEEWVLPVTMKRLLFLTDRILVRVGLLQYYHPYRIAMRLMTLQLIQLYELVRPCQNANRRHPRNSRALLQARNRSLCLLLLILILLKRITHMDIIHTHLTHTTIRTIHQRLRDHNRLMDMSGLIHRTMPTLTILLQPTILTHRQEIPLHQRLRRKVLLVTSPLVRRRKGSTISRRRQQCSHQQQCLINLPFLLFLPPRMNSFHLVISHFIVAMKLILHLQR
mmetsp:Transcript_18526/g.27476  ORF Transcript_18526/g.27476 Transcript_18526/m.27476 type:complete len:226 (-) Transcript_18526:713-1390(-)